MKWNWQKLSWPDWQFDASQLQSLEAQFMLNSGRMLGVWQHLSNADKHNLTATLLSEEAIKTSEIEGEYLDRKSVRSSIRRHFGLSADAVIKPKESGIAEVMIECYQTHSQQLRTHSLHRWHALICQGRNDLKNIGAYRSHAEPMQVVSGAIYKPKIHFEAPPSDQIPSEMTAFIDWFNNTGPNSSQPISVLARAGIAHLYFVSIHPYEDGNGRLARALTEKVLAQALGEPSLLALSHQIEIDRKHYYSTLEANNKNLDITAWLLWFAQTVLKAQAYSALLLNHLIAKTQLLDRLQGQLNNRQIKVLIKLFDAGPEGFIGGLSAKKYIAITRASPATARRDMADLVEKGALKRTGDKKGARYWLQTVETSI